MDRALSVLNNYCPAFSPRRGLEQARIYLLYSLIIVLDDGSIR